MARHVALEAGETVALLARAEEAAARGGETLAQGRGAASLARKAELGVSTGRATRPQPDGTDEIGLWTLIKEDKRVNHKSVLRPGFQAMATYRLGRWASEKPSRVPCLILAKFMHLLIRNVYGIELRWTTQIGRRLRIARQGTIMVHRYCRIGDDCIIRRGATIGTADDGDRDHAPVIGNRVEIGAGATIIGKVVLGDNVRIGANAVVTRDVPSNSTVLSGSRR